MSKLSSINYFAAARYRAILPKSFYITLLENHVVTFKSISLNRQCCNVTKTKVYLQASHGTSLQFHVLDRRGIYYWNIHDSSDIVNAAISICLVKHSQQFCILLTILSHIREIYGVSYELIETKSNK